MTDVVILAGSKSDQEVVDKVMNTLDKHDIQYEFEIASCHREPDKVDELIRKAESNGVKIYIGIAGLSAALPGYVAAKTEKPVIGVPKSGKLNLDSILSMVQLPRGVPVGVVGLDNGENAALLAIRILKLLD